MAARTRTPARKAARRKPVAAARKAIKAAKAPKGRTPKAPVKAFRPKAAARTKVHSRKRAPRPTCPICGSRDVEVTRPPAKAKAAGKLEAGVVAPLLVDRHGGLTCRSCGFREEAA